MAFVNKYYIADTHFGHSKIIEMCNRPFKNVDEMDATLVDNWNNTVRKDDIIYHLGDFAVCDKDRAIDIFNSLNGKKFLILGNHDYHDSEPKDWLINLDWHQKPRDTLIVKDGILIHLNHYALRTWKSINFGAAHFFGHSHGKCPNFFRSTDVGVDAAHINFKPKKASEIIESFSL